jgi:serine O-acetyltransferase
MGGFWSAINDDIDKELEHLGRRSLPVTLFVVLMSKSLHVVLVYRVFHHLHRFLGSRRWLWLLTRPFFELTYRLATLLVYNLKGIEIPYAARIGPGLRLVHPHSVVLAPQTRIGAGCTIFNSVTFGVNHMDRSGFPRLGNDVVVYPGARIIGNVEIGDTVIVGPNSVVVHDIPSNSVAVGIPAVVKRRLSSLDELSWTAKRDDREPSS